MVAQALRKYKLRHVVLDPVMVATSGDRLIAEETVSVLVQELFPLATVITPNRTELREVVGAWKGETELEKLAQGLRRQLNLQGLLVTRSEEGMSLYDDAGALNVGAQAREVFDVTGAGDTVIATLATLLGSGMTLRDALPWANKAGGIVVGKFGTASVSWQELAA